MAAGGIARAEHAPQDIVDGRGMINRHKIGRAREMSFGPWAETCQRIPFATTVGWRLRANSLDI